MNTEYVIEVQSPKANAERTLSLVLASKKKLREMKKMLKESLLQNTDYSQFVDEVKEKQKVLRFKRDELIERDHATLARDIKTEQDHLRAETSALKGWIADMAKSHTQLSLFDEESKKVYEVKVDYQLSI